MSPSPHSCMLSLRDKAETLQHFPLAGFPKEQRLFGRTEWIGTDKRKDLKSRPEYPSIYAKSSRRSSTEPGFRPYHRYTFRRRCPGKRLGHGGSVPNARRYRSSTGALTSAGSPAARLQAHCAGRHSSQLAWCTRPSAYKAHLRCPPAWRRPSSGRGQNSPSPSRTPRRQRPVSGSGSEASRPPGLPSQNPWELPLQNPWNFPRPKHRLRRSAGSLPVHSAERGCHRGPRSDASPTLVSRSAAAGGCRPPCA